MLPTSRQIGSAGWWEFPAHNHFQRSGLRYSHYGLNEALFHVATDFRRMPLPRRLKRIVEWSPRDRAVVRHDVENFCADVADGGTCLERRDDGTVHIRPDRRLVFKEVNATRLALRLIHQPHLPEQPGCVRDRLCRIEPGR